MKRYSRLPLIILSCLVFIVLVIGGFLLFRDMTAPTITLTPDVKVISTSLRLALTLEDEKSSIKKVEVVAKRSGRTVSVLEKDFASSEKRQEVVFTLADTGFKDGTVELEVTATDGSYASFGFGNSRTEKFTFEIDNVPVKISVKTTPPNVRRGGAGVILYSVSKDVVQTGVKAGSYFFPGFRQKNGDFICFFAYPYHMTNEEFVPQVVAVDMAGNLTVNDLTVNKIFLNFKQDTITVNEGFLSKKADEFVKIYPGDMPLLERFLQVNGAVRQSNAETLMQVGRATEPKMLWTGSFLALPRSKVFAIFAEHRTYMFEGKVIDKQTHLGYDLASVKNAPVPAANTGVVSFADYLGIYGNLVVIDHGLGVQSLYAHLSEIGVQKGQQVMRGEIIGKTGVSGIAFGDHLHFGMLISGLEVAPAEWLDANWLQNNIAKRIKEAGGTAPVIKEEPAPQSSTAQSQRAPIPRLKQDKNAKKETNKKDKQSKNTAKPKQDNKQKRKR